LAAKEQIPAESDCVATGFTFNETLQISLGRSNRFSRSLTNEIKVENRFIKASHKILGSLWSAQIEELVLTPNGRSNAVLHHLPHRPPLPKYLVWKIEPFWQPTTEIPEGCEFSAYHP